VFAGQEYGTGSSRGWATKRPLLLGVRAIVASSFDRYHRIKLARIGLLPLQPKGDDSIESLGTIGDEAFDNLGLATSSLSCLHDRFYGNSWSRLFLTSLNTPHCSSPQHGTRFSGT
jgi:hypothetical protein